MDYFTIIFLLFFPPINPDELKTIKSRKVFAFLQYIKDTG